MAKTRKYRGVELGTPIYYVYVCNDYERPPKLLAARLTDLGDPENDIVLAGEAMRYMNIGNRLTPEKLALFSLTKKAAWNKFAKAAKADVKTYMKEAERALFAMATAKTQAGKATA